MATSIFPNVFVDNPELVEGWGFQLLLKDEATFRAIRCIGLHRCKNQRTTANAASIPQPVSSRIEISKR